jgi:lipopolysaccharide biosynthesis glycosyltransferase
MIMAAVGDTPSTVETQNVTQNITYCEKTNDVIPVVLSADNNYGPQMYITMLSILKNSNVDTRYDFYLLVSPNFEKRYKYFILELGDQYGCKINFIDMGSAFADSPLGSGWPAPTYYRLLIPGLLPNCKKCLYLDTDIIVRHDLAELFNTDLKDCYIAGSDRYAVIDEFEYLSSINLDSTKYYVNAGVLVMNLDLMRRDNLQEKLVSTVKHGVDGKKAFMWPDQDALNIICRGRMKILDLKFNVSPGILDVILNAGDFLSKMKEFYGEKQFGEACNDPLILHFAGRKPWETHVSTLDYRWWEICRLSPFYEEMLYKYTASMVMADIDAKIDAVRRECNRNCTPGYNKCNYYRCIILSKLTFGKKKAHYQHKCEEIKKVLGIH